MASFLELRFPKVFVMGQNAILESKRYLYPHGNKFLFVMGCGPILDDVTAKIKKSFADKCEDNVQESHPIKRMRGLAAAQRLDANPKTFELEFIDCEGQEVCEENIANLAKKVNEFKPDLVIGVGGGKALDLTRAQLHVTGVCTALFPTAAATNAPGTRLNIVYEPSGDKIALAQLAPNYSELILLDTALLIGAPARTIAAGIGDCVGTVYEGLLNAKQSNSRDYTSSMAWAAFLDGEKVLRSKGVAAYYAAQAKTITNDYNLVVEHLVLGNGLWAGAIGGLHLTHVLDEVLLCFEPCRKYLHGHLIGYGVIPMWVLEGRPIEDIHAYVDFCQLLGIPVTMEEMGIGNVTTQQLIEASEHAMNSTIFTLTPAKITKEDLYQNVLVAENIVTNYLAKK